MNSSSGRVTGSNPGRTMRKRRQTEGRPGLRHGTAFVLVFLLAAIVAATVVQLVLAR